MIFAVVDDGIVVGTLSTESTPSVDVPNGRLFVNITSGPHVSGGEHYDHRSGTFMFPVLAIDRIAVLERDTATLKADVAELKRQKV